MAPVLRFLLKSCISSLLGKSARTGKEIRLEEQRRGSAYLEAAVATSNASLVQ